jgi:hypothetical protein
LPPGTIDHQRAYWFFQWFEKHRVTTEHTAKLLLSNPVALNELRELAQMASTQTLAPLESTDAVLAGRGIDLSGQLDCLHIDCRRLQVQRLFSKVWHYFDVIVVQDSVAHEVAHHWDSPTPAMKKWLLGHIAVLLYLREIGAESLLEFRMRPPGCLEHLTKHTTDAGLQRVLEHEDALANEIAKAAQIELTGRANGGVDFSLYYPPFEHTQWGSLNPKDIRGKSVEQQKIVAARQIIEKFLAYLAADVTAARQCGSPLGAAIPFHNRLLQEALPPTVADVAVNIELPVLQNVSPSTLIEIRRDEAEHFLRFKSALRMAIEERLRNAATSNSRAIAREIVRDVIDPELHTIRARLKAAERAAAKKPALGLGVGALATACGILVGLPARWHMGAAWQLPSVSPVPLELSFWMSNLRLR